MKGEEEHLSQREREFMDIIYRLGQATANRVQDELSSKLANATVRTILRILEGKGHLSHTEEGRSFIYSPTRSRTLEAKSALKRIVGVFYEGSIASAMAGLLQMKDTQLSNQDLDQLESLIQAAKEKGGKE